MKLKKVKKRCHKVEDIWSLLENGYLSPETYLEDPLEVIKAIDTVFEFVTLLKENNLIKEL